MNLDDEPLPEITSRQGYLLKDLARAFLQTLSESGPVASGKLLHYTADLVASGGLALWEKLLWDYAYDHVGTASPRMFHFLFRRFREINEVYAKMTMDAFCRAPQYQQQLAEMGLILQASPKRSKTKYPTVPMETHDNEEWLRSALRTTDKVAVRKVWQRNSDMELMLHAGNEMVYAITEGSAERALFWVKWLLEEDALTKKRHGSGLTTVERGPPHAKPAQKASVGYYIIGILAEVYKEFAEKGMVRMHEEFQAFLDMYRSSDAKNTQRKKLDTIGIMVQLLTEVPKWKVPAAPSLVTDPTHLQRMVSQAERFFLEVLALPVPRKMLPATLTGIKQKKVKEPTKEDRLQQQLAMVDQAAMSFYKF